MQTGKLLQENRAGTHRMPLREVSPERFWIIRKLEERFVLERKEFAIPGISRRHFEIRKTEDGYVLTPLSLTNPLYRNGILVDSETVLRPLGQLSTGLIRLVFLPGLLLMDIPEEYRSGIVPDRNILPARQILLERVSDGKAVISAPMLEETFSLEAPGIVPAAPSPHWFSVLGPSLMSMVSSLASAGTMLLKPGSDWSTVLGMSSTSMTMAAAFLAYGLINRRIGQKGQVHNRQKQEELYLAYLKEQEEVLQEKNARYRLAFERQKASLSRLDDAWKGSQKTEEWTLPVLETRQSRPAFSLPAIRYDQKEQSAVQALEAMEGASLWSQTFQMLKRNEVLQLGKISLAEMEDQFLLWNWMVWKEDRRFVRIGTPDWSKKWMEQLPSGLLEGQRLHFATLKEFLQAVGKNREVEWTILCTKSQFEERLAAQINASWIVMDPELARTNGMIRLDPAVRSREKILCAFLSEPGKRRNPSAGWPALLQEKSVQADDFRKEQAVLEVVLGVNEQGEEVKWDLEVEGPHALIAGTTGSGKSEGLASVLLQLALHNSARLVQFLLIDFKGGAFISQFQGLPHFAGALTNLEQSDFARLQAALDQELAHRQKRLQAFSAEHPFAIQDVASLNSWHPEDPISHLFIVVDEFAQMKSRFPEAMAYMQEAARIGRSLGIHLILATQKPAGIVDEQIWSNSRSRLCFSVHDQSDSRQVLGHGQAAELKRPGEFILQVSGSEQEKTGRALFSRLPCERSQVFVECDENRRPLKQKTEKTMAMRIQELAVQAEIPGRLLLTAFESPQSQEAFAFVDQISSLAPLFPEPGENLLVLGENRDVELTLSRIQSCQDRIVLKTEQVSGLEAARTISRTALWQLVDQNKDKKIVLVMTTRECREHPLMEELLLASHLNLVVVCSSMENADARLAGKMDLRMAFQSQDRESLYLLFGQLCSTPKGNGKGLCLSRKDHQIQSFVLSSPVDKQERSRKQNGQEQLVLLPDNPGLKDLVSLLPFFLGFSTMDGRPLCWSRKRSLVIVCALERLKQPLEQLLSFWKSQDPLLGIGPITSSKHISILCLPQDQSLLMDPAILQKVQNSSLLYVGHDYSEHQFVLKRRGRQEAGNLLYFEEEEPVCGRLLPLSDAEGG